MAMFILGHQWLQIITFMAMNVLSMSFVIVAKPFTSQLLNNLTLFNEACALVLSYLFAQINDLRYDPETTEVIGDCIVYLIYVLWAVNGVVIASVGIGSIYNKLRHYYYSKLRWKYACLRP